SPPRVSHTCRRLRCHPFHATTTRLRDNHGKTRTRWPGETRAYLHSDRATSPHTAIPSFYSHTNHARRIPYRYAPATAPRGHVPSPGTPSTRCACNTRPRW